jgi:DNA-binding NarL/FixJ family response regulator
VTTVAAPPLRVVLADDSAESRELLRAMLGSITGVEVIGVAVDGRQAVDLLQTMGADVVFLDIAMPVMDGLEAAAVIRAHHPDLTIIVYSAYDRVAMGLSALAAGADEYFQKAATVGQLVEQLRRAFPGRSMHINTPSAGLDGAAEPLPLQRESLRGAAPATDQRFRALLDALEQGVLITDPVAVVTDANTAATRILQLPLGRVTGHTLTEVGLDDAGVIADGIRSGRRLQHLDYPLHRSDGATHPVLLTVRPMPAAAGAPPGEYLISITDPPGQDTERRARQVLDTTQEGVWSIDTDDVTTYVNAKAAALLGYTVVDRR